jgi:hypothetical protein
MFLTFRTQHNFNPQSKLSTMLSIFLVIFTIAIMAKAEDFEAPWYYHGLDGPVFSFTAVDNNVTTRNYVGALWASTDVLGTDINEANNVGFNRLFEYISGANDQSMTIDMTTPVLNYIQPPAGPNCNTTFTVSFYVPYKYQTAGGPPKPTASNVYIQTIPDLFIGVTEYGGFATQKEDLAKVVELEKQIENSKDVAVDSSTENYYYASYDPPFRLTNRHNEMWVPIVLKK